MGKGEISKRRREGREEVWERWYGSTGKVTQIMYLQFKVEVYVYHMTIMIAQKCY